MTMSPASFLLPYGSREIPLVLPEPAQAVQFSFQEPVYNISQASFQADLGNLLGKRGISGSVAIVVADKTRLCGYPQILPWVVDTLQRTGIHQDQITFYIAYGTHAAQSEAESLAAYGEVYKQYRFVHHDCNSEDAFIHLGSTSAGTPVRIRRELVDADLILTIGAISHHYFAGYGGGRKLLFPGLAEKQAIYANHGLFLDQKTQALAQGCWPGTLQGNPLAQDLREVHDLLPPYLSIHALLNSKGQPASYAFGTNYDEFLAVCTALDTSYKVQSDEQFDLVLASAGGYPKDINLIQAHKAIHNAANLVRDGGHLIMLAECRDGVGSSTFLPYFAMGKEKAFAELAQHYVGNGGTALAMMEKTRRITITLVSELAEDICLAIGLSSCAPAFLPELLSQATQTIQRRPRRQGQISMAVIANASLLVADRFLA